MVGYEKGFASGLIMNAACMFNFDVMSRRKEYADTVSGAFGVILPFVFQALLEKYGYKTTLQATATTTVILTGPLISFCKSRLPASVQSTLANMDWKFRRDLLFWVYTLSTIFQGFGLFSSPFFWHRTRRTSAWAIRLARCFSPCWLCPSSRVNASEAPSRTRTFPPSQLQQSSAPSCHPSPPSCSGASGAHYLCCSSSASSSACSATALVPCGRRWQSKLPAI